MCLRGFLEAGVSGGAGGRCAPQTRIFCVQTKRGTKVSWLARVEERNATQRGLGSTPPPSSGAAGTGEKLAEGAVPGSEEAVVVLARANGDAEVAGEAHRGAVAHEDARLEERDADLIHVLAHARKHEVGLRGRRGRSPRGQLREETRPLRENEGTGPLQVLGVLERRHRRHLCE